MKRSRMSPRRGPTPSLLYLSFSSVDVSSNRRNKILKDREKEKIRGFQTTKRTRGGGSDGK